MPKLKFSDVAIRAIKPPEKGQLDFWDAAFPSFGCRVSQGGSKTFVLKLDNQRRTIGRFPVVTLSAAREQARRILAERTLGKTRPHAISYSQAVTSFIDEKKRTRRPKTWVEYERLLNRLSFTGSLADITHDRAAQQLARIKATSEHDHAVIAARIFFRWCRKRHYIDHDPVDGLIVQKSKPRSRVLSDDEIRSLWTATDQPTHFNRITRLLLLTGMRRGECAALQSSWIKDNTICLPKEVTKNGRELRVPVGTLAQDILAPLLTTSPELLFPATGKEKKPVNGWSKPKAVLDKLSGVLNWTLHDLRRTYRTVHARIGTPPHIAERLVNHVSSRSEVERIYDQHTYFPDMISAVKAFDVHLRKVISST